jgi:serine/threonine protein kinase
MAPEYYYRGEVSAKSDIYSLGILIIEIVTGLKVDSNTEDLSSKNLIDNVRPTYFDFFFILENVVLTNRGIEVLNCILNGVIEGIEVLNCILNGVIDALQ